MLIYSITCNINLLSLFFVWFVYGNYCIIFDKYGVDDSLSHNRMVTYYITILVLLGFFIFSRLIFYIVFFICFCPCLIYVLCTDLHRSYIDAENAAVAFYLCQRVTRYFESKREEYDTFTKRIGLELESCVICVEEFKSGDIIIGLDCNLKYKQFYSGIHFIMIV